MNEKKGFEHKRLFQSSPAPKDGRYRANPLLIP